MEKWKAFRFTSQIRKMGQLYESLFKLFPQSISSSLDGMKLLLLLDCCRLFQRGCVYGCADDAGRFSFFCHAALEFLLQGGFHPVWLLIQQNSQQKVLILSSNQRSNPWSHPSTGHSSLSRLVQCSGFMAIQGSLRTLRFN